MSSSGRAAWKQFLQLMNRSMPSWPYWSFATSLDPDGSLAEIARVLKGGGRALIVDLEPHDLTSFREAMREVVPGIDPRSLASQMAQAKLDNVRWKRLISTGRDSRLGPDLPAPELFVMTAEKPLSTGIS